MKKDRRGGRSKRPPKLTSQFPIGSRVLFYAYADSEEDLSTYFLCEGIVVRLPKRESPVYKVVIVGVMPKTLFKGGQTAKAQAMLRRMIPREEGQLTDLARANENTMTLAILKTSSFDKDWLRLSPSERNAIASSARKKIDNG